MKHVKLLIFNKASGGDEIPVELFQILKDGAVKMLHSICQKIWIERQPVPFVKSIKGGICPVLEFQDQLHVSFIIRHNLEIPLRLP